MIKVRPSHLNNIWAATALLTFYWVNHRVNCKHRQVGEGVRLFMPFLLLGGNGFFSFTLQATGVSAASSDTGQEKNVFRSMLKFRVILIAVTFLNSNMITKLPYHPPMFRQRRLNLKTMFVKTVIYWFLITL
jgi:hypothetical protein